MKLKLSNIKDCDYFLEPYNWSVDAYNTVERLLQHEKKPDANDLMSLGKTRIIRFEKADLEYLGATAEQELAYKVLFPNLIIETGKMFRNVLNKSIKDAGYDWFDVNKTGDVLWIDIEDDWAKNLDLILLASLILDDFLLSYSTKGKIKMLSLNWTDLDKGLSELEKVVNDNRNDITTYLFDIVKNQIMTTNKAREMFQYFKNRQNKPAYKRGTNPLAEVIADSFTVTKVGQEFISKVSGKEMMDIVKDPDKAFENIAGYKNEAIKRLFTNWHECYVGVLNLMKIFMAAEGDEMENVLLFHGGIENCDNFKKIVAVKDDNGFSGEIIDEYILSHWNQMLVVCDFLTTCLIVFEDSFEDKGDFGQLLIDLGKAKTNYRNSVNLALQMIDSAYDMEYKFADHMDETNKNNKEIIGDRRIKFIPE